MEIPKINNQPKAEVEKTPQENEDLLNEQEQESGKRENITLEIAGQKIEAVKYYFEYPERIQKETGILGYERVKIQNSELSFLAKELPIHMKENLYDEALVLSLLSNDEYPNQCFTHVIGGFAGKNDKTKILEDFVKDRFFLQKIYDTNTIERNQKHKQQEHIFNYPTYSGEIYPYSNFTLYDKNTNNEIIKREYIGKLPNYKQGFENNEVFAATVHGGLNMESGSFWHRPYGLEIKPSEVAVGFPANGTDTFFIKYLEESIKNFILILYKNKDSYNLLDSLFTMYAINKYSKEYGFIKTEKDVQQLLLTKKNICESFLRDHALPLPEEFHFTDKLDYLFDKNRIAYPEMNTGEVFIPIFIGHNEAPQLSWGHAKYAHYKNEKELNFFKFKHADHLPVKEEMNSFDS